MKDSAILSAIVSVIAFFCIQIYNVPAPLIILGGGLIFDIKYLIVGAGIIDVDARD